MFLVISLAVFAGLAVGAGGGWLDFRFNRWDGDPSVTKHPVADKADSIGTAKVVVDREEFNFGTMDSGEERSHDFVFTNKGTAPLALSSGATSCKCTVSLLDKGDIPPGKSTKVTVKWKTKEVIGPYRQTALILTNDPDHLEVTLTLVGEVTVAVRNDPPELIFSRLSVGETADGLVRLLCYLPSPRLRIIDFKLSDQATAKYFQVTHEELPEAEVRKEKGAKSGILLRVKVKPGLPQGPFQQTILLATNLESNPAVTVPLRGTVASDITIAGAGWDPDLGVLNIGTVPGRTGTGWRLLLIVRGPHAKEVKFESAHVEPEFLRVEFGRTTSAPTDTMTQTPLFIRIPEGTRPVNHLGSEQGKLGEILLTTTHPQVPQLRIRVRFAVEGGS